MNFVSESELQTQKEAGLANDEPVDHRPLYERLKEVREKAEAEREEMFALKNQFKGLDEDETEFLDKVNQAKSNFEKKKRQEEEELLKQALRADAIASSSISASTISLKPSIEKPVNKEGKSQKDVLKKLIVKRKSEPTASEEVKAKQRKDEEVDKNQEDNEDKKKREANTNQKESGSGTSGGTKKEDVVKEGKTQGADGNQTKPKKAGELLIGYAISSDEED